MNLQQGGGDEYDKARLFPTQLDAIVNIAEFLKNNPKVRVYLRIHPNLNECALQVSYRLAEIRREIS